MPSLFPLFALLLLPIAFASTVPANTEQVDETANVIDDSLYHKSEVHVLLIEISLP